MYNLMRMAMSERWNCLIDIQTSLNLREKPKLKCMRIHRSFFAELRHYVDVFIVNKIFKHSKYVRMIHVFHYLNFLYAFFDVFKTVIWQVNYFNGSVLVVYFMIRLKYFPECALPDFFAEYVVL